VVRLLAAARQPLRRSQVLSLTLPDGRITVASIGEAVASGMVLERGSTLAIAHDLYAEAIEDHELPNERSAIHAALALALTDRPARAAYHWRKAARTAEARAAHLAAAEEAASLDPGDTTLVHLQGVLELSADAAPGQAPDVGTLLRRASRATAASGAFRRAAALMRRAVEATLAGAAPRGTTAGSRVTQAPRDDAQRLQVGAMVEEIGRFQWAGGDLAGAFRSMEQALAMMPAAPSPERARALASLAQHLMIDGRFSESARLARPGGARHGGGRGAGRSRRAGPRDVHPGGRCRLPGRARAGPGPAGPGRRDRAPVGAAG
jgi:hypothetical protein